MLSKYWKRYCNEDLSNIEGYWEAFNDKSNTRYHCHHKNEIEMNLSMNELIEKDLYWKRPASELIILTAREHQQLHRKNEGKNSYSTKEEALEAEKSQNNNRSKKWYQNHKEEIKEYRKEYMKEYRQNHKEEKKEYMKEYRQNNKEQIKEYRQNNKEQIKEYRQSDKYKVSNRARGFGCRHNWPDPSNITFPKKWTELETDEYKRLYANH